MKLTESEIDTLKYEAESIDMRWHENYNGRYNVKVAYAISGSYEQFATLLTNLVSMVKYAALDDEVDEAECYENIIQKLMEFRQDNLGLDYIWY